MSGQVWPFGKVPVWVLQQYRTDAWLYAWLSGRYGGMRRVFPGIETIAAELCVSPSSVKRSLRILRDAGAVEVVQRSRARGGRTTSEYVLHERPPSARAGSAATLRDGSPPTRQ